MNSRIFGDEKLIHRVEEANPGDPTIYVNMDAINQLPDQFEAHVGEVKFDPEKDWDSVGNENYMPQPQVYSDIALKRGVECLPDEHCEVIKDDIDINPMLCKGLEEEPTIRRMDVGYVATKRGAVMIEDGTYLPSDVCRDSYNAWERCTALWAKEEEAAQGYDPALIKEYPSGDRYIEYTWDGKKKKRSLKYDNTWKRRKHFAEEMLFAQRKSDTKARHVVIRHLAGLKTGYKKADIQSGSFVFVRIQRSREYLKLLQAAEIDAIRRGVGTLPDNRAGQRLFGAPDAPAESTDLKIHEAVDVEPESGAQPPLDPLDKSIPFGDPKDEKTLTILDVIQAYYDGDLIAHEKVRANADVAITYMAGVKEFGPEDQSWNDAVKLLARIESMLDNEQLVEHEKWA